MANSDQKLKEALLAAWRQSLVERKDAIDLDGRTYPVRKTPRKNLAQVDFTVEGREIRGLEQNPQTKSRWAQLARAGKKVMQFLEGGRYVAVAVDGELTWYGGGEGKSGPSRRA